MKRHPQTPPADQPFSMISIAPNIYVKDLKQTIDFYKMLGFEIITSVNNYMLTFAENE
jgi:predicted lactoylglutathione lyase